MIQSLDGTRIVRLKLCCTARLSKGFVIVAVARWHAKSAPEAILYRTTPRVRDSVAGCHSHLAPEAMLHRMARLRIRDSVARWQAHRAPDAMLCRMALKRVLDSVARWHAHRAPDAMLCRMARRKSRFGRSINPFFFASYAIPYEDLQLSFEGKHTSPYSLNRKALSFRLSKATILQFNLTLYLVCSIAPLILNVATTQNGIPNNPEAAVGTPAQVSAVGITDGLTR